MYTKYGESETRGLGTGQRTDKSDEAISSFDEIG